MVGSSAASDRPVMGDDYMRTGFGSRIGFGQRPAIVVVDMVRAYLAEGEPFWSPAYTPVVEANRRLLAAARPAGVPVIWTTLDFDSSGFDTGWFLAKVPSLWEYIRRPELAEFDDRLAPVRGDLVVRKQFASSFFGTSLSSALARMCVDTVLITGVSTSGCVRATAVDALQLGYRPIVVADAVGDRHDGAHRQSLFDLEAKYADVETSVSVIQYLKSLGGPPMP